VRCRPHSQKEKEINDQAIVHVLDNNVVVLLDPAASISVPEEVFRQNRSKEKHYAFDYAFGPNASQDQVFDKSARFLIDGVLQGYNATVFAYGATGAGKTYTMLGEVNNAGMMLMTFIELFNRMETLSFDRQYKARISYLEIYNEVVRDLLHPTQETLDIREDPIKGIQIANLSEILATSPEEVVNSIRLGNRRRTQEPTKANETSSRSHAVLQIIVEFKDKAVGTSSDIYMGKLSLIDLAGSERASQTNNRGLRLIEGANINRSLLALGNCINALCEAVDKGGKVYIPYRDSKLTRLLKDSLGGNCRTVMIACISPFANSFEDTHNTLQYANRAKNIKTNVQRNVLNVNYHITKYNTIISQLKQEISDLRNQLQAKQSAGVPKKFSIENYQIEVNNHFKQEANVRKAIYESEQSIDELSYRLFSRTQEYNEAIRRNEEEKAKTIRNELENIRDKTNELSMQVENMRKSLRDLEVKRDELKIRFKDAPEPYVNTLELMYQNNLLAITSLEMQRKENHHELMIKKKEMYIKILENQLKLRDGIISKQQDVLQNQHIEPQKELLFAYKQLQSLEELSAPVSDSELLSDQDSARFIPRPESNRQNRFPPISRSERKNPRSESSRNKGNIRIIRTTLPAEPSLNISPGSRRPSKNILHPRIKLRKDLAGQDLMNRSISVLSDSSDHTSASSFTADMLSKKSLNVADKYARSPYTNAVSRRGGSLNKPRIDPKRIRYGVSIRRIEPL
jgi:kinesin family protein 18/19